MWKIRTAESLLGSSVQRERFVMSLMAFAAGLALLLAGLGTYGVLAYSVQRRAREVGVRMALGATRSQVSWLFLRRALIHVSFGLVIGLAGAIALGTVLQGALVEVRANSPLTLAAVCLLLVVVTIAASMLPALSASRTDPNVVLRS